MTKTKIGNRERIDENLYDRAIQEIERLRKDDTGFLMIFPGDADMRVSMLTSLDTETAMQVLDRMRTLVGDVHRQQQN